ncbi:MAG TPA: aldo/keto reductase [Steroidobacteraceae bacterium]|nr:aldo/keto reductase [Steroidobacteraceae bacterium]
MTDHPGFRLSRRHLIQAGVAAGVAVTVGESFAAAANAPAKPGVIMRTIPSSGEKLPVVGVGTNAYGVTSAEDLAELRKVLSAMPSLGGAVIDTAQAYGTSEEVIGKLLADLGNRDKFFLATKTPLAGDISGGKAVLDNSFRRLGVSKIDLLQIHNVYGLDELMPHYLEYKAAGKIRYIGVTTSVDRQYEQMRAALGKHKFDFMQIDYSIGDRSAADNLLPMAQDKGLAVLNNTPFGGRGRSYFPRVAGKPVPEWAKEFDATTWAQFFLKYNLGHPAITAAIPGTTTMAFLEDNQAGGRGRLPDAAMRKKMEEFWDAMPA